MPDELEPQVPEVPESFEELDDERLHAMYGELEAARTAYVALDRPTGVEAARARRELIESIVAAQNRVAQDLAERIALREPLPEPAPLPVPVAQTEDPPADPDGGDPPADPDPAPAEEPAAELVAAGVTAAIDATPANPVERPPTAPARPRAPMQAAAGQDNQGAELELATIGDMMNRHRNGVWGEVELVHIAGYDTLGFREQMLMRGNHVDVNDALVRESVVRWREQYDASQTAVAGGHRAAICDPLDIIREIPDCVSSATPFADSLPSRAAGRLGFTITPGMSIDDVTDGVGYWTESDQSNVDPDDSSTWKQCVVVTCPTPTEVRAEAVVGCLIFDNTTDMSNPERVRDAMSKLSAARARATEAKLLTLADAEAHWFTDTLAYGAVDGFIGSVLTALTTGTFDERIDESPYIVYVPRTLPPILVQDRAHKTFLSSADVGSLFGYIEGELREAGWNTRVVTLLDQAIGEPSPAPALNGVGYGNQAALAGLGGVRSQVVRLIAPEAALYFTSGEINMGIQRSPELNRRNQAQFFAEEYVGLTKHGCHPWYRLDLEVCGTGLRAPAADAEIECPTGT